MGISEFVIRVPAERIRFSRTDKGSFRFTVIVSNTVLARLSAGTVPAEQLDPDVLQIFVFSRNNVFLIVIGIECCGKAELFQVAFAGNAFCHILRSVQRRQEHSRQNRDDRYYDQQFYQCKTPSFHKTSLFSCFILKICILSPLRKRLQSLSAGRRRTDEIPQYNSPPVPPSASTAS